MFVFLIQHKITSLFVFEYIELRCLLDLTCPTLNCADDEIEYLSQYPSVRKCCPVCIKSEKLLETELLAYQQAIEHYQEAQQQQDELYLRAVHQKYHQELEKWHEDFQMHIKSMKAWEEAWNNYTQAEELLYSIACPP